TVGRPRNECNVCRCRVVVICETNSSFDRGYRCALEFDVLNATGWGSDPNPVALCIRKVRDVIGRGLCQSALRHAMSKIERIGPVFPKTLISFGTSASLVY